jgi:hypothetical protein
MKPLIPDNSEASDDATRLERLFLSSDLLLVKKLSTNDRDWARLPNKHQAGVYIPTNPRDSGFFPALQQKARDPGDAPIRESFFQTTWPQLEVERTSRLVHYTSKGEETHLTGLPKLAFFDLAPASYLVIGRTKKGGEVIYQCLTIDSTSSEAEFLLDALSLGPDFLCDVLSPSAARDVTKRRALTFLEQVLDAFAKGELENFVQKHVSIPPPEVLAELARAEYFKQHNLTALNPFELMAPGDAVRHISRKIEWDLFRDFQRNSKSLELIRLVVGDDPAKASIEHVIRAIVDDFAEIDAMFLSASQQRKSRAGYSFEFQIEQLLKDGALPYERQVVLEAKKRPDFVLPSQAMLRRTDREREDVIILSAKTTLRERWKQVQRELTNCAFYLATVDENIAGNAIEDMRSLGIALVVPESLKRSNTTEYAGHPNVLDFKTFFAELQETKTLRWSA